MFRPARKSAIITIATAITLGLMPPATDRARAGTCHEVSITVAPSKPDGRSWDVGAVGGVSTGQALGQPHIALPDIQPTVEGRTYPRIMDSLQWSRRIHLNTDRVYISIVDWDFFAPDGIGAGTCSVPTNNCRIGQAAVTITPCRE